MSIITLNTRSLPDSAVTTAKINADAVTDAKIADDVIGTEHLTAGEVDATALGADSVTAAKINDDIISGTTALASEPADTDEFLVSDAGTLKRIDYSLIKGGGITMADQWRLTTAFTGNANPIASNWERNDTAPALSYFGSQMTESSGVFSFPSTGIYMVTFHAQFSLNSNSRYVSAYINTTTNNSSFSTAAGADSHISQVASSTTFAYSHTNLIVDITDTSNQKVNFRIDLHDTNTQTGGSSTYDQTFARFVRLGDT